MDAHSPAPVSCVMSEKAGDEEFADGAAGRSVAALERKARRTRDLMDLAGKEKKARPKGQAEAVMRQLVNKWY